jgi:hypothetical protein
MEAWMPKIGGKIKNLSPGLLFPMPEWMAASDRAAAAPVKKKERGMFVGTYVGPPIIWQLPESKKR